MNKFFTQGWTFVRDSSGINSAHFLDKGARFWSRTLLTWDTTVPFIVLFPTILSAVCLYCSVFYRSKISLHYMVYCCSVKGLSERTFWQEEECYDFHQRKLPKLFSWSVLFQLHAIWTFCQKDFDRLFEVNLPFFSKYCLLFWGPLLRFLVFANVDYTKSSSKLGLKEVLLNNLSKKNVMFNRHWDSIIWGIFYVLQPVPQPRKGP